MRVDQYLWYVRCFKSRSLANKRCKEGHVRINNINVKPSREIFIGEKILLRKNQIWFKLIVLDFPSSMINSKKVDIYVQNITTEENIKNTKFQSLHKNPKRNKGTGRPTKKDRRDFDKYLK